jgi:hypothetical protein
MERWAANTLRTLGIILTAGFTIMASLLLLLAALCAGMTKNGDPTTWGPFFLALLVVIAVGGSISAWLARGIARSSGTASSPDGYWPTPPPPNPSGIVPPAPQPAVQPRPPAPTVAPPTSDQARLDQALARYEAIASQGNLPRKAEPDPATPPQVPPREAPASRPVAARPIDARHIDARRIDTRPIDVRHLSPSSRSAIQQLAYAITAKIAAEIALGIVGWNGALGVPRGAPFPVYRFAFIAWGLAAIAPHLVLLYALARRPGPRAFAYSLVIPSLHLLFGIFGHSAFLAFALRTGQIAAPLLSIVPLFLDVLILYLAWKAIRLTGIEPNPTRLIVASVVILLYTSLLPVLAVFLRYWH